MLNRVVVSSYNIDWQSLNERRMWPLFGRKSVSIRDERIRSIWTEIDWFLWIRIIQLFVSFPVVIGHSFYLLIKHLNDENMQLLNHSKRPSNCKPRFSHVLLIFVRSSEKKKKRMKWRSFEYRMTMMMIVRILFGKTERSIVVCRINISRIACQRLNSFSF